MDPQPSRLHDGVIGRSRLLGGPTGDVVGASILRAAVQRHEADGGAQDAFLLDTGQAQELSEIDLVSLTAPHSVLRRPVERMERKTHTGPPNGVRASWRPRKDSNLRTRFRKPMLYPLSYGGQIASTQPEEYSSPGSSDWPFLEHPNGHPASHSPGDTGASPSSDVGAVLAKLEVGELSSSGVANERMGAGSPPASFVTSSQAG
jgi:hypothetical protein